MRKSLVMLVLMTLIGSSFVTYLSNASGTDNAVIELSSDSEQVSNADLVEDTTYGEGTGATIVDSIDSYVVPEHVVGSNPIDYYEGLGETINPYGEMDGRGVVNTSTLIYIKKAPKKVYYGESFNVKIQLLEDNNSDGERGGGDYPIMSEWIDVTWNDGSEFAVYFSNMTHPHSSQRDEDLEDGEFNLTLMANESNVAANGDPNGENPGVELVFTYNGVWTTDGQTFYNLTPAIYGLLASMVIGEDDDNDAPIKQNNNIDDDGDGEPNSPDSFLDSNADGKYQLGEQVGYDQAGGNWIDLDMGLVDFRDNDNNGEKWSNDSYKEGTNGYPDDGVFQISSYVDHEETDWCRYESHYTQVGNSLGPGSSESFDIGYWPAGVTIKYNWTTNGGTDFDFLVSNGTSSTLVSDGLSEDSGTSTITISGNLSIIFRNNGVSACPYAYEMDLIGTGHSLERHNQQVPKGTGYEANDLTVLAGKTETLNLGSIPVGTIITYNWDANNWTIGTNTFNATLYRGSAAVRNLGLYSSGSSGSYRVTSADVYFIVWENTNMTSAVTGLSYKISVSSINSTYLGERLAGSTISWIWSANNWTTGSNSLSAGLYRGGVFVRNIASFSSGNSGTYSVPTTGVYTIIWANNDVDTKVDTLSYEIIFSGPHIDENDGWSISGESIQTLDIGQRGSGSLITYNWIANGKSYYNFGIRASDGVNPPTDLWLHNGVSAASSSYVISVDDEDVVYSLIWRSLDENDTRIAYDIDIDYDWVRITAIADGIDNDNDGIVDEFIDEYIDDGRPAIPAVWVGQQGPEHPNLQRNGIDDDGDGIIDDGYPGIKINENAEGVDEEIFNYADDDGDGLIDEDCRAFVAREPTEKRLYIEIWHKTECSININRRLVEVDDEFVVSGKIWDKSFEETTMGKKNLMLVWDGDPLAQTEAQVSEGYESDYEFVVRVPHRAQAGTHTVSVEFSPGFNKTNNYYFDPCNASAKIDVRRPTTVIFDNVDPLTQKTWVYRGSTIYINGSIVDKYLYEEEFLKQGPQLNVNGVDYGNQYRFHVQWGESIQPFAKEWPGNFLISANGSFSIEYELPAGNQPLGPVKVSVRTTWDTSPGRDPLMFYIWSANTTEFVVRARTELELWIDQNNNGKNDENELNENGQALNTFITRKSFIGANGETYDWNVARVRGILKDQSRSSGSIKVGVPQQRIVFYWNYGLGEPYERKIEEQVDQNGQFDINVPIDPKHKLGPVNIFCVFISEYSTNYYDSSIYSDFDGQPFSVVSFTDMEINASVGVKGKNVHVSGRLTDDTGAGVGNRSVTIYRLERWDGNYNSLNQVGGLGTKLGTATTKSTGKFTFKDYVIEEIINVGTLWLVARYGGSTEFPYGPGDKRFAPEDAYMSIISDPTKFVITTETVVVLNEVPDILIRNGEARITGNLYEAYKGVKVERGVAGQTVTAYIRQNDELIKLGVGRTKTDPEFNGYFEIKTTNVPDKLDVGKVDIIVDFSPEEGPEGIPLFQESQNVSHAEVWSSTRVKEVYFGPVDTNADQKPEIYEDQVEDWVFTFQILEGNTVETSGEPVPYGVVWFNITMGAYSNTTRLLTDIRGRVNFNFTSTFKDSATGVDFEIPAKEDSSNMTVTVNFVGRQIVTGGGYDHSVRIYHCDYVTPEKPLEIPTPWALIFLIIFVLLGMVLIGVFFFYKWIEKRRRLRSLKKIIKKAADQLETGNPYSAVIFKSYQKLGAHLRRYGFMRRDADTFREFEDAVRTALPIDEGSLDSFLDILEEARYSKHVIGEGHRDKAINCLRGVEKSLDNIIFDEEAALRQMELADEEYIETDIVVKGGKGA